MARNKEGFLFPEIDSSKCVECGLCEKSCPTQDNVINPLFHETPEVVEAAWEKDMEARLQSTSGGLFYVFAKKWIESGGLVYGAAFDEHLNVHHVCVNDIDGLKRLRGSKYVQSDVRGIYKEIKKRLLAGDRVMFSGTPCQVAGLKSFLKKDYENLITADLVCHGVPSPLIFESHRMYLESSRGKKLVDYKFRGKEKSGWRSYIKYIFNDSTIEKKSLGNDFFAYCFYNSKFNRKSCSSCQFSQSKRVGDITLSDFWNAENTIKSLRKQRKYGFNMVMCNSRKGENLYSTIKDKVEYVSTPSIIAINGDIRLRRAEPSPADREQFFEDYYAHGYEWLVKNHNPRKSGLSKIVPIWIKNLIYEIKARI